MTKISVILATYNEEKNIKDCLESVRRLVDEIVVVDGTSSDKTVELAKDYTKKIFIRENPLMFHKNKQLAIGKATGDWILYLDADERVTPELGKELRNAISDKRYEGYWVPRKNIIFGKWIEHTGWWPDYQLRLFKRGKAYLPCQSVHEQPKLTGKAGYLRQPLIHYNYQTVFQYLDKLNRLYTENDKNLNLTEGKKINWSDAIRWPADEFMKRFFAQKGYKDGLHGLVLSLLQSFSALITFAKIWEQRNFKFGTPANFLENTNQEIYKAVSDFKYWSVITLEKETKSRLRKVSLKLKRKIFK